MVDKYTGAITRVELNDASFKSTGECIEPTFINYFFGNNGTGKSTIAKIIQSGTGVTYDSERDNYVYLVYNKEFIENNVRSYHNLRSVFTLSENNGQLQEQIDIKEALLSEALSRLNDAEARLKNNGGSIIELQEQLRQDCWSKTVGIRYQFKKTQEKKKKAKLLTDEIKSHPPVEHDLQKLQLMYNSAYSASAKRYDYFNTIIETSILDSIPDCNILSLVITNSKETELTVFLEHIGAMDWFRKGHKNYSGKAGRRCPYCSTPLPNDFEQKVIDSFDTRYKENLEKLDNLYEEYSNKSKSLLALLSNIPPETHPDIDIRVYYDKLHALKDLIAVNLERITEKKAEPTRIITLEKTTIILRELSEIIMGFNRFINDNNGIVDAGSEKKEECCNMVFEHMAFVLKDVFEAYNRNYARLKEESIALQDICRKNTELISQIQKDINKLRSQLVRTDTAVSNINTTLRNVGFAGFEIRPYRKGDSVAINYQVIRTGTGEIADNLSEGEKNFIAFLYFQQKVFGSDTSDYDKRQKIVVIDDPVSSMDSLAMFFVAEQIRKMIEVCRNGVDNRKAVIKGNFIKQIFILTHNAYFHNIVTYRYVNEYRFVSFYLVKKKGNKSYVTLKRKQDPNCPSQWVNVNPVKNEYAALWDEYKELTSVVPLMNVMKRILVYYFLQLCGYDDAHLHKVILDDNKFYDKDGNEDYTKSNLAATMLSCIAANASEFNDGIYYVSDVIDLQQCRDTFRKIFEFMGQEQHYNMMMGKCE